MKKIITSLVIMVAAISLLSLASCGGEKESVPELSLSVETSEITFDAEGVSSNSVITVTTNQTSWEYTMTPVDGNGWLTAQRSDNELRLSAAANTSVSAPEPVTLTFTAGKAEAITLTVNQLPREERAYYFEFNIAGIPINAISENGRYLTGYNGDGGLVFDVTKIEEDGTLEDGYVVPIYTLDTHPDLYYDDTFLLQSVDNNGNPYPMSVTADGSTMVGFTGNLDDGWVPHITINGEVEALPIPDEYLELGSDYHGAIADYISFDGNVVIGRMRTYSPSVSVYWKKNADGRYEWHQIAEELIETQFNDPYIDLIKWPEHKPASGASSNGKYAYGAIVDGNQGYPYIFDVETGETTLVPDQLDADATAVTDDGILFFATPYSGIDLTPYVFENGVTTTFAEWVLENYGLEIENSGMVQAVSRDKRVICWMTYGMEGFTNHIIVVK